MAFQYLKKIKLKSTRHSGSSNSYSNSKKLEEKGFSLLELVIAMVLISILASYSIFKMKDSYLAVNLKTFSEDFRSKFYEWHSLSVRINQPLVLSPFSAGNNINLRCPNSNSKNTTFKAAIFGVFPTSDGTGKYDNAKLNSENCAYFDYLERYGIDYPKINLFAFPKNNKIVLYPDGSIRKVVSGKIERLSVDKSGEEENIGIALFYPEPGDKIGIGHNIFCLRLRTNGEIELSYKNKSITTSTDYEGLCPSKQTSP